MLIWQRLKNTLTQMGYARAAANLAQQGLYDKNSNARESQVK
jgi:hypothetical protein